MLHKTFSSRQCTYRLPLHKIYLDTPNKSRALRIECKHSRRSISNGLLRGKRRRKYAGIVRSPLPQHNLGISFPRKRHKTQIPDSVHKRIHHSVHSVRLSFPDCHYMFRTLLFCTDCSRTYSDQLEHIPYNSTVHKRHIIWLEHNHCMTYLHMHGNLKRLYRNLLALRQK